MPLAPPIQPTTPEKTPPPAPEKPRQTVTVKKTTPEVGVTGVEKEGFIKLEKDLQRLFHQISLRFSEETEFNHGLTKELDPEQTIEYLRETRVKLHGEVAVLTEKLNIIANNPNESDENVKDAVKKLAILGKLKKEALEIRVDIGKDIPGNAWVFRPSLSVGFTGFSHSGKLHHPDNTWKTKVFLFSSSVAQAIKTAADALLVK